jgi:hypothetical protein
MLGKLLDIGRNFVVSESGVIQPARCGTHWNWRQLLTGHIAGVTMYKNGGLNGPGLVRSWGGEWMTL